MAHSPWRDALRRASLPNADRSLSMPTAPMPQAALASASPRLAELMREREVLESRIQSLGAAPATDARYAVTPLAQRRSEFARWSGARDQQRDSERSTSAVPSELARCLADPAPVLRATPGEAVPAGQVPTDPGVWMALRDLGAPGTRSTSGDSPALRESGRALRMLGAVSVLRDDNRERYECMPADALDRLKQRVRRRTDNSYLERARGAQASQALRTARNAIPAAWEERVRERVPGLGKADPYIRDLRRKLGVSIGTLEEVSGKSDRLRETAQALRELQRADEAGDDARRNRALERLQARRAEGAHDE